MTEVIEKARSIYQSFDRGDAPAAFAVMAEDIRWNEAAGGPYGGVFIGHQAVIENVFMRIGGDWDNFAAAVDEIFSSGNTVVALGNYTGSYKVNGKSMLVPFAHVWKFEDGLAVEFRQYADTALQLQVMA